MNKSRSLVYLTTGLVLATLSGCGGGGGSAGAGGSSNPPVYTGATNSAVVTTSNAATLTGNVIGSGDTAATIGGVSIVGGDATQDRSSGVIGLALRLNRNLRGTVLRADPQTSSQRLLSAVIPVDETELCDGGNGSVRTSGTLNDNNTGTLALSFNSCLIDGVTLSGPATLRVDAVAFPFPSPRDFTISFARLTLRGPGLSIDAGGALRVQIQSGPDTETITTNLVSLNNNTGETAKTENLVFVNVYVNSFIGTPIQSSISGRIFHPVHGYVDVTTPTSLVFGTFSQLFPDSGELLLTGAPSGAGNRTIRVTAVNSTLVQLQLDTNGDGTVDNTARLKWTELAGPVGADLGDTDNDGMHNSWETVNGLNPGLNDAASDRDGDGQTNLQEYMAGTTP